MLVTVIQPCYQIIYQCIKYILFDGVVELAELLKRLWINFREILVSGYFQCIHSL